MKGIAKYRFVLKMAMTAAVFLSCFFSAFAQTETSAEHAQPRRERHEIQKDLLKKKREQKKERIKAKREEVRAKVDSVVTAKYYAVDYDTSFISRPLEAWMVRMRFNASGSMLDASTRRGGVRSDGRLRSGYKNTLSLGVNYRGLSAGVAINPMKFFGKGHNFEANLNAYANRYGIDIVFLDSKTVSGDTHIGDDLVHLDEGGMALAMLNVNGYYAFNGKRFSMPAAFSQSYVQRHSAGSFLAGFSYMGGSVKTTSDKPAGMPDMRVYLGHFGVGCGYGYNWVASKRLLLHVSALPTLVIVNRCNMRVDGMRSDMDTQFPDAILTERLALVYTLKSNHFIGCTFVMTNSLLGDDRVDINFSKWRARLFWGMRI